MPEVTRVSRTQYSGRDRDRDDWSSDDERSTYSRSRHGGNESYRTVQRYRVAPSVQDFDDRRSSRLNVNPRSERIEVDTRSVHGGSRFEEPERPRSAIDVRPRSTIVERYVERDPIREPERERTRTTVYERDSRHESDSHRPWERGPHRPWESEREVRETDLTIEKRSTERREEPYELDRYTRETEYYDRPEPPPQPIVIRQRQPEPQQIIVQEAPPPPPIVIPRQEQSFEMVRREEYVQKQPSPPPEPRRQEDEYYYRRDVREVGPRRDEDFAIARRDVRRRESPSDGGYSDEDYVMRRRVVRERSRSGSPHHRRHLAEGALAGAGAAALFANHKRRQGDEDVHRGRNVAGGAALGAIGAEVLTRARSRYRDSRDGRSRSRSSSRHSHSKIKTGAGLAVAALAAAAAVKYAQNRKANKEELGRGRSRTRSRSRRRGYSTGSYYSDEVRTRSRSKHADPKHRAAQMAKAGAATAAVAGVVEHFRSKSRKRSGSRSKSRIRKGAEIMGSGLAGAAVAGLYENRKAKEDVEEESVRERKEHRRRSRSKARSVGAHSDPGVDPELGMVQYGTEPVYTHQKTTTYYDPAIAAGAGAAYGASRSHRSRSRRGRHSSSSDGDHRSRSRSRSRVRDIAGAAAGTAAAAIGINQYKRRKEKKEAERERERRRYEEQPSTDDYYAHDPYDDGYSPSPPHASGGSFYPENNTFPPPPTAPAGLMQHANHSVPNVAQPPIPVYNPQDYGPPQTADPYGFPPTARGPDDHVSTADNLPRQASPIVGHAPATARSEVPYFPPPPTSPYTPDYPRDPLSGSTDRPEEAHLTSPSLQSVSPLSTPVDSPYDPPHNKSVMFAPLSPTSSHRLAKIHKNSESNPDSLHKMANGHAQSRASYNNTQDPNFSPNESHGEIHDTFTSDFRVRKTGDKRRRRRGTSDPSSDRPNQPSKHRRRHHNNSGSLSPTSESDVEILPDRFDEDGRPLDRHGRSFTYGMRGLNLSTGGVKQSEMVESVLNNIGDVVDGKKSWKDLLKGLVDDTESVTGSDSGGRHRRRRR